MGVSTDGQICFGILFEEGYGFSSWMKSVEKEDEDNEDEDEEVEYSDPEEGLIARWDVEHGWEAFKGSNYASLSDGAKYKLRAKFREEHPFPFRLLNVCTDRDPVYILAIKETYQFASRGYPEILPRELSSEEQVQKWTEELYDFCVKMKINSRDYKGPAWFLSSYWG